MKLSVHQFISQAYIAAGKYSWIKRVELFKVGLVRVSLRLHLNGSFISIYYNADTGSVSYAYIEGGRRLFGVNKTRLGWHIHPFSKAEVHQPTKPITLNEFLKLLEKELRKRGKI